MKLLSFVLLCSVISEGMPQSIGKMPENNWWTLSNLNVDIPGSYCYKDSIMYCQKYGRLYTWDAAQKGCSLLGDGWHLPSTAEWNNLLKHFGGPFEEGVSDGKGAFVNLLSMEKPAFAATLAGNRNSDGTYSRIEGHGFYWTSTPFDEGTAGFLNFAGGKKLLFLQPDMEKARAISVRCIKRSE